MSELDGCYSLSRAGSVNDVQAAASIVGILSKLGKCYGPESRLRISQNQPEIAA